MESIFLVRSSGQVSTADQPLQTGQQCPTDNKGGREGPLPSTQRRDEKLGHA